jgi:hypothetical protein
MDHRALLSCWTSLFLALGVGYAGTTATDPKETVTTSLASPSSTNEVEAPKTGEEFLDTLHHYMTLGPFDFHPLLQVGSVYDDNIFISNRNRPLPTGASTRYDEVTTVTPGLFIGTGDYADRVESYFNVSYLPTLYFFQNNSYLDTLEHDALLESQYKFSKLTLKLTQSYQNLSSATVDVGDRTNRKLYETYFGAEYEINDKVTADLSALYDARVYKLSADSNEWSGALFLNYQILPKTKLGIGATGGYLDISDSRNITPPNRYTPNQTYQGGLVRVIWEPSSKLTFQAEGGIQIRQFDPQFVNDRTIPVFSLSAKWQPFNHTDINLRGYRHEDYSNTNQGQNYISTGFSINLQQRLFQKLVCSLQGAYENAEYQNITNPAAFKRNEDYLTLSPKLKWEFNKYFDASVYYRYRKNDSNSTFNTFDNNQYGVSVGAKF